MAQTKLSKIAWTFGGAYVSGQTYDQLTIVTFNGSAYLSKVDGVTAAPTNETYWVKISSSLSWESLTPEEKTSLVLQVAEHVSVEGINFKEVIDTSQQMAMDLHAIAASEDIPAATIAQVVINTEKIKALESGKSKNQLSALEIEEDCLAFVDENFNIGMKLDYDGRLHAKNIIEFEKIESL